MLVTVKISALSLMIVPHETPLMTQNSGNVIFNVQRNIFCSANG